MKSFVQNQGFSKNVFVKLVLIEINGFVIQLIQLETQGIAFELIPFEAHVLLLNELQ